MCLQVNQGRITVALVQLQFEADGVLRAQYGRNYGPPLSIAAFVKELTNENSYTDLVAVHKSLVPPGSFFA